MHLSKKPIVNYLIYTLLSASLIGAGYNSYVTFKTDQSLKKISTDTASTTYALSQKISDLELILLSTQEKNVTLEEALQAAKEKSESLSKEFKEVNENVETLEKITTTDSELLQKYSKIYFLNEHYVPADLKDIPKEYSYNPDKTYEINAQVYPYLKKLLEDAKEAGLSLQIISAFRSFGEQATLKGAYTVTYGAGTANQFSADQGYSEHQLGTTVDFTNPTVAGTFSGFSRSAEYKWLQENAHKYGFTLSYPDNNAYYQFEPWHWRFVGQKLAGDLHDKGKFFYDLSQREIDEYIIYLFD